MGEHVDGALRDPGCRGRFNPSPLGSRGRPYRQAGGDATFPPRSDGTTQHPRHGVRLHVDGALRDPGCRGRLHPSPLGSRGRPYRQAGGDATFPPRSDGSTPHPRHGVRLHVDGALRDPGCRGRLHPSPLGSRGRPYRQAGGDATFPPRSDGTTPTSVSRSADYM